MITSDTKYLIKVFVQKSSLLSMIVGRSLLILSVICLKLKLYFSFIYFLGRYEKLDEEKFVSPAFEYYLLKQRRHFLERSRKNETLIMSSFLATRKSKSIASFYFLQGKTNASRLRYCNEDDPDREGNLILLKIPVFSSRVLVSKGVIYLQYNHSIYEFISIFDLEAVYEDYLVIFEPSSWGYSDLSLELLLVGNNSVFIMAQDAIDYAYVEKLDDRLIPVRAGAGDWINLENTPVKRNKVFDICMISSWRKLKNHRMMFEKLSGLGRNVRIALVGYPWESRTCDNIRNEQLKYYPESLVSIFESVPHDFVFDVLASSKLSLMLSEREGANRGIYESLSYNVPVVMLENNRGVNKDLVSHGCIELSSPDELLSVVSLKLSSKPEDIDVRDKIFEISGHENTWLLIQRLIQDRTSVDIGKEPLISSAPGLKYLSGAIKEQMNLGYKQLERYLRRV